MGHCVLSTHWTQWVVVVSQCGPMLLMVQSESVAQTGGPQTLLVQTSPVVHWLLTRHCTQSPASALQ